MLLTYLEEDFLVALPVLCLIQRQAGFDFANTSPTYADSLANVLPRAKCIERKTAETFGTAWLPGDATASDHWSELRGREEREARGTSLKRAAFGCSADVCSGRQSRASSCKGSCKQSHFTAPSQHPLPAQDPSSTWEASSAQIDAALPGVSLGVSCWHMKGACMADQASQK